jgi:hypothetical protein
VDLLLRAKPEAYRSSFDHLAIQIDAIATWAVGVVPR